MAKAKVVVKETPVTSTKVVEVKKVVIELTEAEAAVLHTLTRHVGGNGAERRVISGIGDQLDEQGILFLRDSDDRSIVRTCGHATTIFAEGPRFVRVDPRTPGKVVPWNPDYSEKV